MAFGNREKRPEQNARDGGEKSEDDLFKNLSLLVDGSR
jgi:hypothetical protein